MKNVVLLLLVSFAFAQGANQDPATATAIEGAKKLHEAMRDPDSFKISRAWIMSIEKFGDVAVCYDYYSRNGFGGMNASHADYAPHSRKDILKRKYILDTYEDDEYFEGFRDRWGAPAIKHGFLARDVTKEVKQALATEVG